MPCHFCQNNIKIIDYKNVETLRNFLSPHNKILARKKTGLCPKHQKELGRAIKRARQMALLSYTSE